MIKDISRRRALAAIQNIKEREYWLTKLSGELSKSSFPHDYKKTAHHYHYKPNIVTFLITDKHFSRLMKLRNDDDAMLYMVLAAELTLLLHKYSYERTRDIIIGAPICQQDREGEFINTLLALRNRWQDHITFRELLMLVGQTIVEAEENQNYPFEILLQYLNIPLETDSFIPGTAILLTNIHDREYIRDIQTDMVFSFTRTQQAIKGTVEYNSLLYKKTTIDRIVSHFIHLLDTTLVYPDLPLNRIEIMSEKEKEQLIFDFNHTQAKYPKDKTIHQLFEDQVERTPDHTALLGQIQNSKSQIPNKEAPFGHMLNACGEMQLSYQELNEKSNQLAHLLREKGAKPDTIVGIMQERSLEMVTTILAVLKAGGAYLPIDPGYPKNRIALMLEDSNTKILFTTKTLLERNSLKPFQGINLSEGDIKATPQRPQILDPDRLPFPDRSLVDYEKYHCFIGQAMVKNSISLQATRGCPYQCAYCHRVWPKHHAARSAENIFAEVSFYYKMGVRRFVFIDDIFNLDRENSIRFFKLIIENHPYAQLFFPNGLRGDILTKDYIDLMVKAGTVNVALALETASPRLQKLIGKNLNLRKLRENLEYFCQEYPHVVLELFTMHGFPTETKEEAGMTLDFIKSLKWLHFPYFHILKIYPNTDMYRLALKKGISKEAIFDSVNLSYHELPSTLPFPKSFTLKYQSDFFNEYFLSQERLLHVLPYQMNIFTEDEIVEKYDSYLPVEIRSFTDLLQFVGIKKKEIKGERFLEENYSQVLNLNRKLKVHAARNRKINQQPDLKVLLLDLSQYFTGQEPGMLYDVMEPPLGLMYLLTYLHRQFGSKIEGKIAKSRIDFDSEAELKEILIQFKPGVIGIRTLSFYKDFLHQIAARIRQWGIKVPLIVGGPYGSSDYKNILKDHHIDLVVLGEGELTFAEIIEKIIKNSGKLSHEDILEKIPGIAYTSIGKHEKEELKRKYNCTREIVLTDDLKQIGQIPGKQGRKNLKEVNTPGDMAYIIYTSGTTGKPKGAVIEHRNVVRLLKNDQNPFNFKNSDTWTMFHSYSFDFSVWEMYGALLYGGRLVVIPKETTINIRQYLDLLKKEKVTVLNQTPSVFYHLIHEELKQKKRGLNLRYVIFGGEALMPGKLAAFKERYPGIKLINMYGITETTVHVTFKEIEEKEIRSNTSNIGRPIPTLSTYVLDKSLGLLPPGVPGELGVAGEGVGRGYLNRPDLTGDKFVKKPDITGSNLYRSGDRVRITPDRELEYLGRIDNQVKIRGFRIELGEIQSRLCGYTDIKDAVVITREDEKGEKYLCAYIVPISNQPVDKAGLKTKLLAHLPEYMLPTYFVQLKKIPVTPNGKLDEKTLPEPKEILPKGDYEAPSNETEEKLVNLWSEILEINKENISINTDFFEIGGHSLNATRLISAIHKESDVVIPFAEIFKTSTIKGIAKFITGSKKDKHENINPTEQKEYYVLSSAQKRVYIMQQRYLESTAYNITKTHGLEKEIEKEKLEKTFEKLIERHESLRTSLEIIEGEPAQRIHQKVEFEIEYDDLAAAHISSFIRPFDLSKAPLLRVGLIKAGEKQHLLIVDMHHIITDAASHGVLVQDFLRLYQDEALPELRLQYKDYSQWQHMIRSKKRETIKKQEAYWLKEFEAGVPLLNLPNDYARPKIKHFEGSLLRFEISKEDTDKLKMLAKNEDATLFMVLLAIFNILLSKVSRQEDIVVGTVVAGRNHADLEQIIGIFVNTLVLRNYPQGGKIFCRFLKEVKEKAIRSFENQDYPFESLVEKLPGNRDLNRFPLYDVGFALQNAEAPPAKNPGKEISRWDLEEHQYENKVILGEDLYLVGFEGGNRLYFTLKYCPGIFKVETITAFIKYFKQIVSSIIKDPQKKIKKIELISEEEKKEIRSRIQHAKEEIHAEFDL